MARVAWPVGRWYPSLLFKDVALSGTGRVASTLAEVDRGSGPSTPPSNRGVN